MGCGIIKNSKNSSKEEGRENKCQIQNNIPQVNINIITNSTRLSPSKFKIKKYAFKSRTRQRIFSIFFQIFFSNCPRWMFFIF